MKDNHIHELQVLDKVYKEPMLFRFGHGGGMFYKRQLQRKCWNWICRKFERKQYGKPGAYLQSK